MFIVTRSRCSYVNIDLNNNVSDSDSNIDGSKEEELQFSLNTGSDGKANEEDDSNTFMEMAYNEHIFEVAEPLNGRLKVCFVSNNVFNLSHRKLSKAEVSLLSKVLKFCPTPNTINKSILKEDLEKFGRKLRLSGTIAVIIEYLTLILLHLSPSLIHPKLMLR